MNENKNTPKVQNKILIVDDNPTNLKVLFDYLSGEAGNKIFVAKNGREALERAAYANPDIILLDIMMPEMDGYETCRRLKEDSSTREIPIIFLTAIADADNKIKAFNSGAVDFIVKPFNQEEVMARIKTHLTISRQRKTIEEANQALAKANTAKDKLFSIIAHDMRNKLFGITGNIEMFQDFYHEFNDKERMETVGSIAASANQMYKLFENLFAWARTQTDDVQLVREQVNLIQVSNELLELYKEEAGTKGVDILLDIPETAHVICDRNMLLFILRNLLQNAIKYCDSGNRIKISYSGQGSHGLITVKDNGVGMTQTQCDAIFDVGKKSSQPGTRKEEGTGLGLTVAKEFAELNRGTLSIISEKKAGTEVQLSIPAA